MSWKILLNQLKWRIILTQMCILDSGCGSSGVLIWLTSLEVERHKILMHMRVCISATRATLSGSASCWDSKNSLIGSKGQGKYYQNLLKRIQY